MKPHVYNSPSKPEKEKTQLIDQLFWGGEVEGAWGSGVKGVKLNIV